MKTKINPCPACGSKKHADYHPIYMDEIRRRYCIKCRTMMPVKVWNRLYLAAQAAEARHEYSINSTSSNLWKVDLAEAEFARLYKEEVRDG
jgi:hypothetical protein